MKNNKLNVVLCALLVCMLLFYSCQEDDLNQVALTAIAVKQTDLQLNIGEVQALVATATPENATEKISWNSSNSAVAEIQFNDSGRVAGVKGIGLGQAVLTATSQNGTVLKRLEVAVIVKVESIALTEVKSVNLSKSSYKVVFTPANATIQDLVWESSNPNVISVDQNGNVTAISAGSSTITATTVQGKKTAFVELVASGNPAILGMQYCSINGTGSYNADSVVTLNAVDNINYAAAAATNNYELAPDKLVLALDTEFSISLKQSNNWSKSNIWIDWNGDKDFDDAGELVASFGEAAQLNNGPFSSKVKVPASAVVGTTRMRVQTVDAWSDFGLCGTVANQSTKDFEVEILGVTYCSISGTGSYNADAVVTSGAQGNINYLGSQPSGNYLFYTAESLNVSQGSSFNISLSQSNNWSKSKLWIDWNADGDFEDSGELVYSFGADNSLNNGPFNAVISVPSTATKGGTRMRLQTLDAWSNFGLCGNIANQCTLDFKVNIL